MLSGFQEVFVTTAQRIERRQAVALGRWAFLANTALISEV
jgi:hypothetical protein